MPRKTYEQAAATYSHLRGLLVVPLGVLFLLAAWANTGSGPLAPGWAFPVAALAVAATYLPIKHYYNERYGRLTPSARQQVRATVAVALAIAVMAGGSLLLRSRAAFSLDLPVNAIAVSFAVVMLLSYGIGVGLKLHHVVIWGALLVVGAVPLWTGDDPGNTGLVLAGIAVIACGLLDHRVFVQTFGSPGALQGNERHAGF